MKLKDYTIPQYGMGDGLAGEDLSQYSLKNFDLKAFELTQRQPDPPPTFASYDPEPFQSHTDSPSALAPATAPAATNPVHTEPSAVALEPSDVQFGPYFNLQTVSYTPLSPAQSWKLPRWVVATVGVFFGSAAVLTLAVCVVLLRDPNPAPAAQPALPTAAVATTSAAPSEHSAGSPIDKAPVAVTRAASAADQKTMAKRDPADRAHAHHIVVSRHRSVVRRHIDSARRVASKGTSSSVAAQETETASRRPPPDALDQLLSESSL